MPGRIVTGTDSQGGSGSANPAGRQIDEIHDAEHQRQSSRQQEQQEPELQPIQDLFDDEEHGSPNLERNGFSLNRPVRGLSSSPRPARGERSKFAQRISGEGDSPRIRRARIEPFTPTLSPRKGGERERTSLAVQVNLISSRC